MTIKENMLSFLQGEEDVRAEESAAGEHWERGEERRHCEDDRQGYPPSPLYQ